MNPQPHNQSPASERSYLVVGTGGVGGSLASFLALAGKKVTCIARGEQLQAIRSRGLALRSDLKGHHLVPVDACTAEAYDGKADVILVCVKGYSLPSVLDLIQRASHPQTLVIPILNVFGTGARIREQIPHVTVLDGCIYIVAYVSQPGEITQQGKIFRVVFGASPDTAVAPERLQLVQRDLQDCGIKADVSTDIRRDTFVKWSFISAMALTGAYYNVSMGSVQRPGPERDTFVALSTETQALGRRMGIGFQEDLVAYNLKVLDKMTPDSTASMQKDLAKGHDTEIDGLLYQVIRLAEQYQLEVPAYRGIARGFESKA